MERIHFIEPSKKNKNSENGFTKSDYADLNEEILLFEIRQNRIFKSNEDFDSYRIDYQNNSKQQDYCNWLE